MPDSPACRACRKPMHCLDSEEQRWYCYRDDEVFYAREGRWAIKGQRGTQQTVPSGGGPIIILGVIVVGALLWWLLNLFFAFLLTFPEGVAAFFFVVVVNPFLLYWMVRYIVDGQNPPKQDAAPITKRKGVKKTGTQFCANCGNKLATDWKFCKECGAKLT